MSDTLDVELAEKNPMVLQTIIVSKSVAKTEAEARKIAERFGKITKVDETSTSFRFRQRDPEDFVAGSFRTVHPEGVEGVALVVGHLKPENRAARMRATACPSIELRESASVPQSADGTLIDAKLSHDGNPLAWNQIAKAGHFKGHYAGEFTFDANVFTQIIKNFRANPNARIKVDYEHLSETLVGSVAQEGAPAVAWIVDLKISDDGELWALFEWVDPKAVEYVRTNRYRYLSPAVVFDALDPITGDDIGAMLTSVGLTDQPFLQGMAPLAASAKPPVVYNNGLDVDAVHVPSTGAGTPVAPTKDKSMADEQQKDAGAALRERMRALAVKYAGASTEADEMHCIEALEEHCKQCLVHIEELKRLQTVEAERAETEAKTDVDGAIAAGKLEASARESALKFRRADPEAFKAIVLSRTTPKPAEDKRETVAPTDAALLAGRIAPQGGTPPARDLGVLPDPTDSDQVHTRASEMMVADKTLDYTGACFRASGQLKIERDRALMRAAMGA